MASASPNTENDSDPCELTLRIPNHLLNDRIIVFGELHGTKEAPFAFLSAICSILEDNPDENMVVGLEYPSVYAEHLHTYLNSDGNTDAREHFLATPFWTRDRQDGRTSLAMLDLIEAIRRLKKSTERISVVAFVPVVRSGQFEQQQYEQNMAEILNRSMEEHSDRRHVILVGNLHARRTKGWQDNPEFEFMFALLNGQKSAIDIESRYGTYWACTRDGCGRQALQAKSNADFGELPSNKPKVVERERYHWAIRFEQFSASPPAKM